MSILQLALLLAMADEWPQFRGPTGMGLSTEKNLPLTWGGEKGENVRWKAPLSGEGHASPVVWGKRVFVSTVRWPGAEKDPASTRRPSGTRILSKRVLSTLQW